MSKTRIALLGVDDEATNILYNSLSEEFDVVTVVLENKQSKKQLIKNRVKKLGIISVAGQVLFQLSVPRVLERSSQARIDGIQKRYKMNLASIPQSKIKRVSNANDPAVLETLKILKCAAIVVSGTRILKRTLIEGVGCPMINWHAGITPLYRGVHGGYWALTKNDREGCGVTVHVIDAGVDTGGVLYRTRIEPEPQDNFVTYPVLQLGEALPLLKQAVRDAATGKLKTQPAVEGESAQWYHPTLWNYLWLRFTKNVK